jgi:FKBP-type peptidyl-prolyl cis-trans isomerase FklB
VDIGNMIKRAGFEVDPQVVSQGIADVLGGKTLKLTEQQARETIMAYQQQLRAKRDQEKLKIAEQNRNAAAKFFAENKTKPGVKTKEVKAQDGSTNELQYKVLAEGSGDSPKAEDTVTFNYKATSIDGKELDSSAKRGQPGKAVVGHYPIAGVKEALQSMQPGAKWELFIPSSLAFGDAGAGQNVEPGAAIIYEIELLSVDTPQPLTSDIIKVPSKEELDKGAKIEVIKPEDVKKLQSNAPAIKR